MRSVNKIYERGLCYSFVSSMTFIYAIYLVDRKKIPVFMCRIFSILRQLNLRNIGQFESTEFFFPRTLVVDSWASYKRKLVRDELCQDRQIEYIEKTFDYLLIYYKALVISRSYEEIMTCNREPNMVQISVVIVHRIIRCRSIQSQGVVIF